MTDKHVFKILERSNEVLLIIEVNSLKFMQEINEDTFNLPYLKNKDLLKFLSKVIDKFEDKTLKFDYTLKLIDKSNLNFKIFVWDGTKHVYDIILKSREYRDNEIMSKNIKTSIEEYDNKIKKSILEIDRKYDDECDEINSNLIKKTDEVKKEILTKYINDTFRNYEFKSFRIIKCINKINKSFEMLEEIEKDIYKNMKDNFFENLYNQLIKCDDFNNFSKERFNEHSSNELHKKIYYSKMYLTHISIYNVLEFILNSYGLVNIISLNLDYNKGTFKVTLDVKFLFDISEKRIYKCIPSLYKQKIENSNLIYNSLNNLNYKKDSMDIFIFQQIK